MHSEVSSSRFASVNRKTENRVRKEDWRSVCFDVWMGGCPSSKHHTRIPLPIIDGVGRRKMEKPLPLLAPLEFLIKANRLAKQKATKCSNVGNKTPARLAHLDGNINKNANDSSHGNSTPDRPPDSRRIKQLQQQECTKKMPKMWKMLQLSAGAGGARLGGVARRSKRNCFSSRALLLPTLQSSGQMMKKPLHTFVRSTEVQPASTHSTSRLQPEMWMEVGMGRDPVQKPGSRGQGPGTRDRDWKQPANPNCEHKTMLRNWFD